MADGDGCRCWASNAVQCGCPGVDWTPQELIDARVTIAELKADMRIADALNAGLQAQIVRLRAQLRREATSAKAEAVQD